MKTSVSIPDDLFRAGERHARRTRQSRSELYAAAFAEYLERPRADAVTDAMNRVVAELPETDDAFVREASRRILERSEW